MTYKPLQAQSIKDNSLYFFSIGDWSIPRVDTLKVKYSSNDTILFEAQESSYIKAGDKISIVMTDSFQILLYDYSHVEGDTFVLNMGFVGNFPLLFYYVVDSVVGVEYLDGDIYKEWHLHEIGSSNKLVWIENLGTKRDGWFWAATYNMGNRPLLKVICLNQELILWDFPNGVYNPTCNYDSLAHLMSVNEIIQNQTVNLYPNPTSSELTLERQEDFSNTQVSIHDINGRQVYQSVWKQGEEKHTLNTSDWQVGVYYVTLQTTEGEKMVRKLMIIR